MNPAPPVTKMTLSHFLVEEESILTLIDIEREFVRYET